MSEKREVLLNLSGKINNLVFDVNDELLQVNPFIEVNVSTDVRGGVITIEVVEKDSVTLRRGKN